MTDRFDEWKFPETFDEDTADTFLKFAHTFDKDSGDYAVFPWQFPQTFETAVESVTASQTTVTASGNTGLVNLVELNASQFSTGAQMNPAATLIVEQIGATPVASVGTANAGSISAMSQPATSVSTAATMPTLVPDESISSTQFGVLATSNDGLLSNLSTGASVASVSATENSTEVEGIVNIRSAQATVSASQNIGAITAANLNATQSPVTASMGTPAITDGLTSAQVATVASVNTTDTIFNPFIDASQFTVRANMLPAKLGRTIIRQFGDVTQADIGATTNTSDITATDNSSTIEATVNEVE